MKSILGGFAAAILLALVAWGVLDGTVQRSSTTAHTTASARP